MPHDSAFPVALAHSDHYSVGAALLTAGRVDSTLNCEPTGPADHRPPRPMTTPATLPAGPYRVQQTCEGEPLPHYVLPFDADGVCKGPQTLPHLLLAAHGYSNIFLFSHGWNNDWAAATQRYEEFIQGVQSLRREHRLPAPADYKPLLVGIFWRGQALAWFESEVGTGFAAGCGPAAQAAQAHRLQGVLQVVTAALPKASRARFFELATANALQPPQARELDTMLAGATSGRTTRTAPPSLKLTQTVGPRSEALCEGVNFGQV